MIMHVNKVHHVTTITRVAANLGEDEDWLWEVASEMEIEDGVIWVYGVGEDGVLAFTDFGIENFPMAPALGNRIYLHQGALLLVLRFHTRRRKQEKEHE